MDDDDWFHKFQKLVATRLKEMLQQGLGPDPPKIAERLNELRERERSPPQPDRQQNEKSDPKE
jgi:hypothetical protein